jgi:hypothetical protein
VLNMPLDRVEHEDLVATRSTRERHHRCLGPLKQHGSQEVPTVGPGEQEVQRGLTHG